MISAGKLISALSATEYSDLREIKAALSAKFLASEKVIPAAEVAAAFGARALRAAVDLSPKQNVVGVGIDEKYVDDVPTGVPVVKFLVRSKVARSSLSKSELLPAKADGIETDVEETGPIVPQRKPTKKKP